MKVSEILKSSKISIKESQLLLAYLLKCRQEYLISHLELDVKTAIYSKYKVLERKRLEDWSIAVLIGKKEFFSLEFKVDKNVLVPRPETELMVEELLSLALNENTPSMIIDLGTGSGAIIISLAHELSKLNKAIYNKTEFKAIDISSSALKIARENAKTNKQAKKIDFLLGNLLEPLVNKRDFTKLYSKRLLIAANLPYLSPLQIKSSPSISKEPGQALVAGRDGLKCYRELFNELKTLKLGASVLCEIDDSQHISISLLAKKYFPHGFIKIKKDLAGKRRLAIIETIIS
ncbi:MAG: peptide chain release factor N(5)-glutamine methyltransferase [Candidatus Falkowbacteria bacterium]